MLDYQDLLFPPLDYHESVIHAKTSRKGLILIILSTYYESLKRELKTKTIYGCRCDERLKTKGEGSTSLISTVFHGELEHLKIETRLIDERFASVMGECDIRSYRIHVVYSSFYWTL